MQSYTGSQPMCCANKQLELSERLQHLKEKKKKKPESVFQTSYTEKIWTFSFNNATQK